MAMLLSPDAFAPETMPAKAPSLAPIAMATAPLAVGADVVVKADPIAIGASEVIT
jgi:hypothetical protein